VDGDLHHLALAAAQSRGYGRIGCNVAVDRCCLLFWAAVDRQKAAAELKDRIIGCSRALAGGLWEEKVRSNFLSSAAFPPYMLGASADQHRYGPYPPLAEKQREMRKKQLADLAASKARAVEAPASAATKR